MSVERIFNNRTIVEPGAYAQTDSRVEPQADSAAFGNVLIIDTGSGANWGGGSGINGELASGLKSVYDFSKSSDFKNFVKGGMIWDYSKYIFNPLIGASAPERIFITRACKTVPAKLNLDLYNGSAKFSCRNEGVVGNGILDEKKATGFINFSPSDIVTGNEVTFIKVNEDGTEVELLSNIVVDAEDTVSSFKQKIVDGINNNVNHNYKSELSGTSIVLVVPDGLGSTANNYEISITAPTINHNFGNFAGGADGEKLIKGYSFSLKQGVEDINKLYLEFYRGTFNGKKDNFLYGQTEIHNLQPEVILQSPEIENFNEIVTWAQSNDDFNKIFKLDEYSLGNWDIILSGETFENKLAEGGSEIYRPEDLDRVLNEIKELNNTFILSDKYGKEAISVQNEKILQHVLTEAVDEKFIVIGGGSSELEFQENSLNVSEHYDSERVIVIHDGVNIENRLTGREKEFPSIYHAANVVGRLGGLEPQDPLTFKSLRLKSYTHDMNIDDRKKALRKGVLHNRNVNGVGNVINQGVNSLQNNNRIVLPEGKSYEISVMSISAQLNKELSLNLKKIFPGNNRATFTKADVKSFIENYLLNKVDTENPLILKFQNVSVDYVNGDYNISYGYEPNGPINKMFVTGFMLNSN